MTEPVVDKAALRRSRQTPMNLILSLLASLGIVLFLVLVVALLAAVAVQSQGNAQHTGTGLQLLEEWLGKTKWDLIHFNWGLHDMKSVKAETGENSNDPNDPRQADAATYTANLEILVKQLKATGAKLIFATKHDSPAAAKRLRRQLIWQTALALPLRVVLFSPKLIARMWGRLMGVLFWTGKGPA